MRTHGHREENITHRGLWVGALGRDSSEWEDRGGTALGEIHNVDHQVVDAANYHDMCIPM